MISLASDVFEGLVRQTFDGLPAQVKDQMDNLDVVVEDWPLPGILGQCEKSNDKEILGLFVGVPKGQDTGDMDAIHNVIWLFQRPIESICCTEQDVALEIKKTILHEIGHYMGLEDYELERMGYG